MRKRNFWLMGAALMLALMWTGGMAWAASPHFIDSKTKVTITSDGDLNVRWKEAGLGDALTDYTISAIANATWTCVNKSGRCPEAANKVTTSEEVAAVFTFSPKNGTVNGNVTLGPEAPTSAPPTCGGGQSLELSEIFYTNISLVDTTNNVTATGLPTFVGPVVFFVCP